MQTQSQNHENEMQEDREPNSVAQETRVNREWGDSKMCLPSVHHTHYFWVSVFCYTHATCTLENKCIFEVFFSSYIQFFSFHYYFLKNMAQRIPDLHSCESCMLKSHTRADQSVRSSSYYSSTAHRSEYLSQK